MSGSPISSFIEKHFRHFNAAALADAAKGYKKHVEAGKKMLVSIAGAMSTAELGISLSEMIKNDKIHFISCTGANLEEDIFNLVAHSAYQRIPGYRSLSAEQEMDLLKQGLNRVTDTCIPEDKAFRVIEKKMLTLWKAAEDAGESYFPHEYIFQLAEVLRNEGVFDGKPEYSWILHASEKNLPMVVPGWEDSTLGNMFAAQCIQGNLKTTTVKSGIQYMMYLADWYTKENSNVGFFQIAGGIAGDFPICVVPMLRQDMEREVPLWGYFCQISDSTTSYGSYSGAVPNEKITWGKLDVDTPSYIIESDATIVAPLVFAYVLDQ